MRYQKTAKLPFFTAIALLGVVVSVLLPGSVFAQTSGVGGKPAHPDATNSRTKTIFVKTIKAGEKASDEVAITNSSDSTKTVLVYATDSVPSSGGAFACAQAVETPQQAGKWIAMSQTSVEIPAGNTVNVPFTITVPSDASPGEANGCIVLQEKKDATVEGGISLNFRTAIRVAILVPGEVRKEVSALDISVGSKNDAIILSPVVKNTGNVSVDAEVTAQLKTVFGAVLRQHKDTFPLLRDQLTTWNLELEKPFWGGFVLATYSVSYDASNNYLGTTNSNTNIVTKQGPVKLVFVLPSLLAFCIEFIVFVAAMALLVKIVMTLLHRHVVALHWKNYKVKEADHLPSLAAKYGISWKLLAKSNGMKAPYNLTPGQVIKVPGYKKRTHATDEKVKK